MAEINVVPYIDVMLVLLVIFMITTPLLSQGVKVDLPKATAQALASAKEPLIVSVDAQGNYYLNISQNPNQPIDPITLSNRISAELQAATQQGETRSVLVKGDAHVDYGKVMDAMVLLQQAGAPSVGLVTDPAPQQQTN
jgi:biopolymer transport protein TolR